MGDLFSVFLKVLYFLIIFGIIILLAYYTTKVVGKRVSVNAGRYMRIIDTLYMGGDRNLIIVKVKDEYLLMSGSNRGMEFIKELDGFEEDTRAEGNFESYLKGYGIQKCGRSGIFGLIRKPKSDGDETDDR